ncbi:hypothetical protein [Streptomyces atratus]|uniref:Transposase n=1 Tax=Streptomyces atratus TaxID=1893 RepID=A0A1K2F7V7_STRAR|nr:hypothetical protein [Streptomyces atratus]SFY43819.1 hypothetical protein SAMN02787144_103938 [Streptomyces atratus]
MTSKVAEVTADQDVFGGVDSHADTIHVAVISDNDGRLGRVSKVPGEDGGEPIRDPE